MIRKVMAEAGTVRVRNSAGPSSCGGGFDLDVLPCPSCGAPMRVVASIEDPIVERKIPEHLGLPADDREAGELAVGGW